MSNHHHHPSPSIGIHIPSRVRIRTHPPLRSTQAWIPLDPTQPIRALKSNIITSFGLHQSSIPIEPQDIILELDGFTFLDQSLCSLINPAVDLIDVKVVGDQLQSSKKHPRSQTKGSPDSETSPPQHLQATDRLPHQPCPSQPVGRITQASQSSQTSSEQESDQPRIIKPLPRSNIPPQKPSTKGTQKLPAPPGQGKASTKARNRRKRRKKNELRELKRLESGATDPNQSNLQVSCPTHTRSTSPSLNRVDCIPNGSTRVTQNHPEPRPHQQQTLTFDSLEKQAQLDELSQSRPGEDSESSFNDASSSSSSSSSSLSSSSSSSYSSSSSSSETSESPSSMPGSASSASSSSPPQPGEKVLNDSKSPAQIIQKKVPIITDPQLAMLSLSNKNKRKNVKRHIDPVAQMNKIVFEFPTSKNQPTSPSHMPPSPNFNDQCHDMSSPNLFVPNHSDQVFEHETAHEANALDFVHGDDSVVTTVLRSHGPPPSVRDPKLIPSNVLITSVNVLNPYWTPGQIGQQQDWIVSTESAQKTCTRTKRNRKNRKKSLKRRRRAARSRLLNQPQGQVTSDGDDDYDDKNDDLPADQDEVQKDVEEAYREFISSGGHGQLVSTNVEKSNKLPDIESSKDSLTNRIRRSWDQLDKVDRQNIELGSQLGIRTIELSLESFTPEKTIYYGVVMSSTATHLVLKIDPSCLPQSRTSVEYQEQDVDGQSDDEEARSADRKESIRAQQRDALLNDLWGDSGDIREWEWGAIEDARKI